MEILGEIQTGNKKYSVNVNDDVKASMIMHSIDDDTVLAAVRTVSESLDDYIDDDMFIQHLDNQFTLVASIEKNSVNIIAFVLNENVIFTNGE